MGSTVESKYNEVGYNEFPLLRSLHSQELILTVDLNITHMTNPTDPDDQPILGLAVISMQWIPYVKGINLYKASVWSAAPLFYPLILNSCQQQLPSLLFGPFPSKFKPPY